MDLEVDPVGSKGTVRLRTSVTTRRYHANELERRTRLRTLEGQARLLLNDLAEYAAWLEYAERRMIEADEAADRWLREVYRPTQARIAREVGPDRDLVQAYCDVLEHKWLLSEQAGRDVGLDAAIESYLAEGAPAPELAPSPAGGVVDPLAALDLEADDIGVRGSDELVVRGRARRPTSPGGPARRPAAARRRGSGA